MTASSALSQSDGTRVTFPLVEVVPKSWAPQGAVCVQSICPGPGRLPAAEQLDPGAMKFQVWSSAFPPFSGLGSESCTDRKGLGGVGGILRPGSSLKPSFLIAEKGAFTSGRLLWYEG